MVLSHEKGKSTGTEGVGVPTYKEGRETPFFGRRDEICEARNRGNGSQFECVPTYNLKSRWLQRLPTAGKTERVYSFLFILLLAVTRVLNDADKTVSKNLRARKKERAVLKSGAYVRTTRDRQIELSTDHR